MNKSQILSSIKRHYNFKTDVEFARYLGITPQNLKQWFTRSTFDAHILAIKCIEISTDWILTGQGTMLKPNTSQPEATKTPTKLSTTVKEDNTLLNHLQKENKELKAEINSLNKQIGKLEGKLESAYELMEDLKKEIPVPGFLRAVK